MRLKLFFFFLILSHSGLSQEINRYMVFFTDKEGTAYSVDKPEAFLSSRALDRRRLQDIPVTVQDLPVSEIYVEQLKEKGVPVYYRSRWMNAVLVEGAATQVNALKDLHFVEKIVFAAPGKKLGARLSSTVQDPLEVPQVQHELLNIPLMHSLGYTGKKKMIAVLDDGFIGVNGTHRFDHLFRNKQLLQTRDFVGNSSDVFRYDDHGTKSLSTIAAVDSGTFIGSAPDAHFLLAVTEDVATEYIIEEYNWLLASEWADSLGADIITSSLGYATFDDPGMNHKLTDLDGKTTPAAKAAVWATERGMLVVNSAGNSRNSAWGSISTPADAPNILAVGAIDAMGNIASFSSPGPAADGRIKPDVVAMGVGTVVIGASGNFQKGSGTSFAGPQIAGLAAGVWQAYPSLTNLEIRELIIRSANRYTMPDDDFGYGLPDFDRIYNTSEEVAFQVYPNPVIFPQDVLHLKSTKAIINPVQARVLNVNGMLMMEKQLQPADAFHYKLDVSQLAAGLYVLQLMHENGLTKYKFLRL